MLLSTGQFFGAGASTPPPAITGFYALVNRTTDFNNPGGSGDVPIPWTVEASDEEGVHDGSANTRFTIPATWNGRYVRVTYNIFGNTNAGDELGLATYTAKGGTVFQGRARPDSQATGGDTVNGKSAIVPAVTGEYYEIMLDDDCTVSANETTWAQIELMPSDFSGCMVYKSGSQAISASTLTDLTWATEAYDLGGWFDSGTSTTNLTVPSGVTLVRVSGGIYCSDATGQLVGSMQMDTGSGFAAVHGLPQIDCDTDGIDSVNLISAPIAVAAGDDIKMLVFHTSAVNVEANTATWFQIEELPSDLKYALVRRSSDQSLTGGAFRTASWNDEVVDTSGFHDNSTNPSRLTVPVGSGITKVRVCGNFLTGTSVNGVYGITLWKNGAAVQGGFHALTETAGTDSVNAISAILDVTEGDYFEMRIFVALTTTLTNSTASWFSIEEVRDAA